MICFELSSSIFFIVYEQYFKDELTLVVFQAHVQALEGLLVEDQVLLLAGCPLEDDASLATCGVTEHCTLEVAGRLLGGQFVVAKHFLASRKHDFKY